MSKPVMVYDGNCEFCIFWISRWRTITKDKISYQSKSNLKVVELVMPNGCIYTGALAVLGSLAYSGSVAGRLGFWLYQTIPLMDIIFEMAYYLVAKNRPLFYRLTKLFFK